jgi:hypothetical protein
MSDFQNSIKKWVFIDNQIKKANTELYELRKQRRDFSDTIFSYVETNKLDNAVIEISDGTLKFQQNKSFNPLTFKYIESCLNDCISDEEQVKMLMKYIKNKREYKFNSDIRRQYK